MPQAKGAGAISQVINSSVVLPQLFKGNTLTIYYFTLPFPISINDLYNNNKPQKGKKGRSKKPRYKNWILRAQVLINFQRRQQGKTCHKPLVSGKYDLTIIYGKPDKRKRDIANFEKGVSDLLVSMNVVEEDSLSERIHYEYFPALAKNIRVILKPYEPPTQTTMRSWGPGFEKVKELQ